MKTAANILKKFKSLDNFGQSVSFLIDGKKKSKSYFGAVVTLFCAALVGAYFIYMTNIMLRFKKNSVNYIMNENVFSLTDKIITPKDRLGFNLAFGVVNYSNYKAIENIEKIGTLKA